MRLAPLRVVVEPNVLVSAFISAHGLPFAIRTAWLKGAFEMIVSPHLLAELEAVLVREKFRRYRPLEDVAAYLALFEKATLVDDPVARRVVPLDSADDYIMALGQVAGADYVVSGDSHLTLLTDAHPPVLRPRTFFELLITRGLVSAGPKPAESQD